MADPKPKISPVHDWHLKGHEGVSSNWEGFEWTSFDLTHWDWDKMAAIFADGIFKCIILNENFWISNEISLKHVP